MKIAVVYWSGTGNTEAMADAVAEGIKISGSEADLLNSITADELGSYDAAAFGCPAMGAEELEDSEFEPVFSACIPGLVGKKVVLFGSYDWGDGEWLRNWEETCKDAGIGLGAESVKCNNVPDAYGLKACADLGKAIA